MNLSNQFFKILLCFVMVMLLGSYIVNKLQTDYATFDYSEFETKNFPELTKPSPTEATEKPKK